MFPALRHWRLAVGLFVAAVAFLPSARAGEISLALANSTCDAMMRVADLYRATVDRSVRFSFHCKSSGLLAKGMQGGALRADVFVSADRDWMDYAVDQRLVARRAVTSPWGNALVVAAPRGDAPQPFRWEMLASDAVTRILIGDPSNAPFGRYAKEALEASGLWEQVKHKIETRKHVQLVAESLAEAGPGTVGILFRSSISEPLQPLHTVDRRLHRPIRYYLAPLAASAANAEVQAFVRFLQGPAARRIFAAAGFEVAP